MKVGNPDAQLQTCMSINCHKSTTLTVKESPSAAMTLTSAALTYSTRTEENRGNQ